MPSSDTDIKAVKIISYIIYAAVWIIAVLYGLLLTVFGGLDSLERLCGSAVILIGIIIGVLFLLAPFYLRKFIAKNWVRAGISAGMAIIYAGLCLTAIWGTNAYFNDFTQDKWLKYPEERYKMVGDLKNNHGLIGLSAEEVISLLGEPNVKSESIYTYYCSERGYSGIWHVEVIIEEGKVAGTREFFFE